MEANSWRPGFVIVAVLFSDMLVKGFLMCQNRITDGFQNDSFDIISVISRFQYVHDVRPPQVRMPRFVTLY